MFGGPRSARGCPPCRRVPPRSRRDCSGSSAPCRARCQAISDRLDRLRPRRMLPGTVCGVGHRAVRHGGQPARLCLDAVRHHLHLVVLVSLNDPSQAFSVAVYRILEVLVGTACAMLVAILLAPDADGHRRTRASRLARSVRRAMAGSDLRDAQRHHDRGPAGDLEHALTCRASPRWRPPLRP